MELAEIDTSLTATEIALREHEAIEDLDGGGVRPVSIADAKTLDKARLAPPPESSGPPSAADRSEEDISGELKTDSAPETVPVVSIQDLVREHKSLRTRKTAQMEAVPELERQSLAAQDEGVLRQKVLEEYREWLATTDRSLLSKLGSRMDRAVALGQADLLGFQNGLESLQPHQTGTLSSLRTKFHKTLLVIHSILITLAGIVAAIGWGLWSPVNDQAARDLGGSILFWTAVITPAVLILSLLLVLIPYHRKWAAFERSVEIQLTNLERIEKGTKVCRGEIQRMTALHSQTIRWLKILATVTHTPWQIRPSWLESGLKTLDLDSLPFAMRVAQADDGDQASFATLVDSAQTKLEQAGWRRQAFERLIAGIQNVTGRSGRAFSLEALDQDLPHATNNSRNHLEKYMSDNDILQQVAVQYLKPIIEELQSKAMATARPEVVQAENDPLLEVRGDIEEIDEYSNRQKWDDFLSHTLTLNNGETDPVTALSVMSIAPEQIMGGEHQNVSSYALVPEHVYSKLDPALSAGLIKRTYDSKVARPLDTVIRVDVVGPLSLRALRLMSGAPSDSQTADNEDSNHSKLTTAAFPKTIVSNRKKD